MRVLIIGGTAFMGPHLVRQLVALGHDGAVFHRGHHKTELPNGVTEILGDRHTLPDFLPRFRDFRPDALIDMMCLTEADAETTTQVARDSAPRLIVASSIDVYRA